MNWFDLLPHDLAKAQIAWELDAQALRAWRLGFKLKQIGMLLHISPDRARTRVFRAQCRNLRNHRSPAERYRTTLDDVIVVDYFLNETEIGVDGPVPPSTVAQATLTRLRDEMLRVQAQGRHDGVRTGNHPRQARAAA